MNGTQGKVLLSKEENLGVKSTWSRAGVVILYEMAGLYLSQVTKAIELKLGYRRTYIFIPLCS